MTIAVAVGLLTAAGVYLVLRRDLLRVVVGFVLLGHAVNLLLLSAGGLARREPPLGAAPDPAGTADPLPQAFVLTAIVITFGITVHLLGLVGADGGRETGADGTRDHGRAAEATGSRTGPVPVGEAGGRHPAPEGDVAGATGGQAAAPDGTVAEVRR